MAEHEVATVALFTGPVSCSRTPGPLGLTLAGHTADRPEQEVRLAFAGTAPAELPGQLDGALIERAGSGAYRIVSGARSWTLTARSLHMHRDVAQEFYRAIPPRPAPLRRRLLFGAMLALARSRAGIALLRALRG
jgi:hypothetical protein